MSNFQLFLTKTTNVKKETMFNGRWFFFVTSENIVIDQMLTIGYSFSHFPFPFSFPFPFPMIGYCDSGYHETSISVWIWWHLHCHRFDGNWFTSNSLLKVNHIVTLLVMFYWFFLSSMFYFLDKNSLMTTFSTLCIK